MGLLHHGDKLEEELRKSAKQREEEVKKKARMQRRLASMDDEQIKELTKGNTALADELRERRDRYRIQRRLQA
jgi:hypothetical protein